MEHVGAEELQRLPSAEQAPDAVDVNMFRALNESRVSAGKQLGDASSLQP